MGISETVARISEELDVLQENSFEITRKCEECQRSLYRLCAMRGLFKTGNYWHNEWAFSRVSLL